MIESIRFAFEALKSNLKLGHKRKKITICASKRGTFVDFTVGAMIWPRSFLLSDDKKHWF